MASAGHPWMSFWSLQLGIHELMHPSVLESLGAVACFLHFWLRPSDFVSQHSEHVEVGHVCSLNLLSVNQMHKHCINDASAFPFMQK